MEPKQKRQLKYQSLFKEEIQEAAYQLILNKGITNVTLVDIAQAVGTSRVTLYKHYHSIHDIIFDIQIRILTQFNQHILQRTADSLQGSEKLKLFLYSHIEFFEHHKNEIVFTSIFDHAYRADFPSEELQMKYREFISQSKNTSSEFITTGIQDGSLKSSEDPQLLSETIIQSVLGLMQRLATRKRVDSEHFKDEDVKILEHQVKLILDAIVV
jgi:AcrR family transcriptional regulator